jgi:hypothetical protein
VLLLLSLKTYANKSLSYKFGLCAFFLALTFLLSKDIIVSEKPSWTPIVAYGSGYVLWLMSIISLTVGQYIQHREADQEKYLSRLAYLLVPIYAFSMLIYFIHYSVGENSRRIIDKNRSAIFSMECNRSKTIINFRIQTPESLYIKANYADSYEKRADGKWHPFSCCGIYIHKDNMPLSMAFIEIDNRSYAQENGGKFIRINKGSDRRIVQDEISSAYGVFADRVEIDKKYNIESVTVKISEIKTGRIVASTSYAFNGSTGELCTDLAHSTGFSPGVFVMEFLGFENAY